MTINFYALIVNSTVHVHAFLLIHPNGRGEQIAEIQGLVYSTSQYYGIVSLSNTMFYMCNR